MFRRRDEIEGDDFSIEGNEPRTSFGGFEAPKDEVKPQINEEAIETISSSKASGLFKTISQPESSESATPARRPVAGRQAFLQSQQTSTPPSTATKTTTGSPSSRFEGVEAERRLTVGYGITLNGKVSNCDKLIIYGTVDAELDNVKTLHISESGTFKGTANIDSAEISGNFEGDINVADTIIINSTGRVNGKITYGSIEIRPGGKFTGQIVEAKDNAAVKTQPEEKPKTKAKKKADSESASQEFQLSAEPLENEEVVA